jgi:hypothetical protein
MITLIIAAAFKGTKAEFAKALLMCVCIDAMIVVCCMNLG